MKSHHSICSAHSAQDQHEDVLPSTHHIKHEGRVCIANKMEKENQNPIQFHAIACFPNDLPDR